MTTRASAELQLLGEAPRRLTVERPCPLADGDGRDGAHLRLVCGGGTTITVAPGGQRRLLYRIEYDGVWLELPLLESVLMCDRVLAQLVWADPRRRRAVWVELLHAVVELQPATGAVCGGEAVVVAVYCTVENHQLDARKAAVPLWRLGFQEHAALAERYLERPAEGGGGVHLSRFRRLAFVPPSISWLEREPAGGVSDTSRIPQRSPLWFAIRREKRGASVYAEAYRHWYRWNAARAAGQQPAAEQEEEEDDDDKKDAEPYASWRRAMHGQSSSAVPMRIGSLYECEVLEQWLAATPGAVVEEVGWVRDPLCLERRGASPDGIVTLQEEPEEARRRWPAMPEGSLRRGLIEIKTSVLNERYQAADYCMQMQWQMHCTGTNWCLLLRRDLTSRRIAAHLVLRCADDGFVERVELLNTELASHQAEQKACQSFHEWLVARDSAPPMYCRRWLIPIVLTAPEETVASGLRPEHPRELAESGRQLLCSVVRGFAFAV